MMVKVFGLKPNWLLKALQKTSCLWYNPPVEEGDTMSENHVPHKDYGFLYRIIPAPHSVVKFWLDQPMFVNALSQMEAEGIAINCDSMSQVMSSIYEMMVSNPALAEANHFVPGLARRAMKKLAKVQQ